MSAEKKVIYFEAGGYIHIRPINVCNSAVFHAELS